MHGIQLTHYTNSISLSLNLGQMMIILIDHRYVTRARPRIIGVKLSKLFYEIGSDYRFQTTNI